MDVATSDLIWLAGAALLAGIVRGFAGFGTAMVYMPIAASVLPPFTALTTLIVKDLIAPLMHVPRAVREGHPGDVVRLAVGALAAVPVGVYVLSLIPAEAFRWAVSILTLLLLAALVTGLRYRGRLTRPLIFATGGAGGFLAGATGLPGPPVIMVYMASTLPASVIRANLTLYLILADVILMGVLWIGGFLVPQAIGLGLALVVPYLVGNWAGAWAFRPEAERVYRAAAYVIIAGSALLGLPIWG